MIINEHTYKEIYSRYFNDICRFLNFYTNDYQTIEDVVQEVFVKLWNEKDLKEIRYIKTYLLNSARNRMLNHLRDTENHKELLTEWAKSELELLNSTDCVDRNLFIVYLHEAIDDLPIKCKEIFIASREEKMSYKEIASKFNISVKTVENQMGIALRKIRHYVLSRMPESRSNSFFILFL